MRQIDAELIVVATAGQATLSADQIVDTFAKDLQDRVTIISAVKFIDHVETIDVHEDRVHRHMIVQFIKPLAILEEEFLIEPEKPSLVHGDLWNGNVMCGPDGKAMLIDPACYIGHAEVDLAMTELFGGFPHSFYASYNEVRPLQPGYPTRRNLYNLYQLLNHLNLFGPGYLGSVQSIVEKYVG